MRIFIFEYATGGGLLASADDDRAAFARFAAEGGAMLSAVATDFANLKLGNVCVLSDRRYPLPSVVGVTARHVADAAEFDAAFDDEAGRADYTLLIAPECDGELLRFAERVLACGGQLLGPSPAIIRLSSDKGTTAAHLARHGVPVPAGARLIDILDRVVSRASTAEQGSSAAFKSASKDDDEAARATTAVEPLAPRSPALPYPIVLKPSDGAGSLGLRRLDRPMELAELPAQPERWRVEEFCEGVPASVALLCGPAGNVPLAPCRQLLSDDGSFCYFGGCLPLSEARAKRATRLASAAATTLPGPLCGYIGVDLVLGAAYDGSADRVIEINPRLTTSYVGLRALAQENLAAAMLDVARGALRPITFAATPIRFTCDGRIEAASPPAKTLPARNR